MLKNVAGTITVLAIDTAAGTPKTGDAANITLYYNGDNGGVTVFSTGSGHPSEDDATNAPGCYTIANTAGESNFDRINITGKSSTSGIRIIPILNIQTLPHTGLLAPATLGRTLTVGSDGLADANMVKAGPSGSGTAQTARDLGASVLLAASQHVIVDSGTVSDTSGTTTLLARLTATRTGNLDNLDAASSTIKVQTDKIGTTSGDSTNITEIGADVDELGTTIGIAGAGLTGIPGLTDPWAVPLPGSYGAGTAGKLLSTAGAAADPLLNTVPGSYASGTAGYVLGHVVTSASLPANFSVLQISLAGVVEATVVGVGAPTPIVSVQGLDAELSTLITYELSLEAGLHNQMASIQSLLNVANTDPQPTYTVSGPDGSQTLDWNGYRQNLVNQTNSLLNQLNDSLKRVNSLFDLKMRNLPFFKVRRGR
jgi:hypothetical protein